MSFNFFGDNSSSSINVHSKEVKKSLTFSEALSQFIKWLYSEEELSEEIVNKIPLNTLITLVHNNNNVRKLVNDFLNSNELYSYKDKYELMKFIKHLVKVYCIPASSLVPLYKKYNHNNENLKKDWKFVKPYELSLVSQYLPKKINRKNVAKEKVKQIKTLDDIKSIFKDCKSTRQECIQCTLKNGIQVLFDSNSPTNIRNIDVLFVAEAPGEIETQKGVPLIGRSGQKLRPFIYEYLGEYKWFITNTCLCRPEGNRQPTDQEISCCSDVLDKTIELTSPRIIVALGTTAMKRFGIDVNSGILNKRCKIFTYKIHDKEYPAFCTVHPSYVLRNNNDNIYREDFSNLKHWFVELNKKTWATTKKESKDITKGSMYSIQIKKEYYEDYDLVDIQHVSKKLYYILRHKETRDRKTIEVPPITYAYCTPKKNDDFIKHVSDTYLAKDLQELYNLLGIDPSQVTVYEGDIEIPIRHTIDYFYNKKSENKYTPRVSYIDIEVATKNRVFPDPKIVQWPISMVSIKTPRRSCTIVNSQQVQESTINDYQVIPVPDEKTLVQKLFEIIFQDDIDIITAWNISFDLGYIINRYEKKLKLSSRKLSPLNQPCTVDLDKYIIRIPGLICVDLLSAYRSITYGDKESYSLGFIAEIELGESKLEKGSDFGELFKNDIQRAIEYNIDDVEKIYKIDKKLGIIDYLNELRTVACIPWKDVLTTSKLVEGNLLKFCKENNVVIRNRYEHVKSDVTKVGAYVKTPIPGIHDNVYLVDFKSLYPSIMMTFNIGLDTFVAMFKDRWQGFLDYFNNIDRTYELVLEPHLKPDTKLFKLPELKEFLKDKIITPYGTIFLQHSEKTTSITYQVLDYLLKHRTHYKKLYKETKSAEHDNKQRSYKEIANSNYGYYGFDGSRLYNTEIVNSVTVTGQFLIKLSGYYAHYMSQNQDLDINKFVNEIMAKYWMNLIPHKKKKDKKTFEVLDIPFEDVIYTDTDSIYFKTGETPEESKEKGDRIFNYINETVFNEVCKDIFNLNSEKTHLLLEFEALCKGYWPGEKKRYCYVKYKETDTGYQLGDEIEIKGLEIRRSDYPRYTREKLTQIVKFLLKEQEPMTKIESFIKEVYNDMKRRILDFDTTICKPVSYSTGEYKKVPSHVIGMKLWNILNNREDFRPGTKGYQFLIKFNHENLPDSKLKQKITTMLQECGFKGKINNIAIPEDYPKEEVIKLFEKYKFSNIGKIMELDIDRMLDFIWVQRCINLLHGIGDISYVFGKKSKQKQEELKIDIFDF